NGSGRDRAAGRPQSGVAEQMVAPVRAAGEPRAAQSGAPNPTPPPRLSGLGGAPGGTPAAAVGAPARGLDRGGGRSPRPASPATVKRMLQAAHLTGTLGPRAYFPAPRPTARCPLHALDWTERYLVHGAKVYAFHTLDLDSRAAKQTISPDKSSTTLRRHALD